MLVGVAAAALYLPTLSYPLVWDDVDLVQLNRDRPLAAFGQSFWHGDAARALGRDAYYRPLVNFSLRADRAVGGGAAWYYHLVNCILHGLCAALACQIAAAAGAPLRWAGAGGLLFGLHPMLADSVGYVSGRTDVLCGIGVGLALFGLLKWLELGRLRDVGLVLAGTALSLGAKETALVLVIAVPAALLWARRGRMMRRDWLVAVAVVLPAAGYLAARTAVLGSAAGFGPGGKALAAAMLALNNAGRTALLGLAPFVPRVFAWDGAVLAAPSLWLVPLAALAAAAFWVARRHAAGPGRVLAVNGVLLLAAASGLAQYGPLGRAVYLPGLALIPFAAAVAARLTLGRARAGRAALGVALLLAAAAVPLALGRMRVWQDGYKLFSRMTEEAPGYAAGHFNLAFEHRRRGETEAAMAAYRRVIELDSTAGLAWSNLGAMLQGAGRLAEAARMYEVTVRLLPDYALARNNLGIVLYQLGDADGAVRELERAVALNPRDAGAAYNLARVLQRTGRPGAALAYARRAAELEPGNQLYRSTVRELESGQGAARLP